MNTKDFIASNARWLSAGAILTFLSSFGQTFFISLFAVPVQTEFSLSHGQWGSIYALGTAASAVAMIWAGTLADTFRTRTLGIFVLFGLAASCLFMSLNSLGSLLFLSVFLLRLFGQGMASHTAIVAMSRWFVATRGRALAICTLGFTLGEALFPLTIVSLLSVLDWRVIWFAAAVTSVLGVPYLLWALKTERHPKDQVQEKSTVGMASKQWSRKSVIRHPLFWFMVPALLGPSAFNTAFFFHHAYFAETKGLTQFAIAAMFPVYTIMSVVMMVASGWLVDKFGSARTMPFYQLPMALAFLCFAAADGVGMLAIGFAFLACTAGFNSTIPNSFWAEFYGTRHIGSIKSVAAAIMVLGSALGPLITGVLIDKGIDIDDQYVAVALFFLVTTLFMFIGIQKYKLALPDHDLLRR